MWTTWRFVRSASPPTLYDSPGTPASRTRSRAVRVVLHVEPVAHVLALTVDRQRLAGQCAHDHERDELLGELERTVVVRAVADEDGKAVRLAPGPDEVIGRCLGSRVGGSRVVAGGLREGVRGAQRAEDLVGGDVVKAKARAGLSRQGRPVGARLIEQDAGADHVGLHELEGAVDRPVDVRSAARWMTASGRAAAKTRFTVAASQMSPRSMTTLPDPSTSARAPGGAA